VEPEFQYVSAEPAPSATSDATIRWTVPALSPAEWRLLTYGATLDPTVPLGTLVQGPTYLTCSNPDCVAADTICQLCTGGCFIPCNQARLVCSAVCGGST